MFDFLEAQGQNLAFSLGLVRHAPAQVHLAPGDAAALAQPAQFRVYVLDQFLALLLHVAERGRDEDTYLAPVGGELFTSVSLRQKFTLQNRGPSVIPVESELGTRQSIWEIAISLALLVPGGKKITFAQTTITCCSKSA